MASTQGICKNCGSLIILNDREELCECLFCDCVFPTSEAIAIAENPEGYTFPNEPQPKREGVKRNNVVQVYLYPVPNAIKQQATVSSTTKIEKNPYEVSADQIKAPKEVVIKIAAAFVAALVLVLAISMPLYFSRQKNEKAIAESIDTVFEQAGIEVKTEKVDGLYVGFSLSGQRNNRLRVVTDSEATPELALDLFKAYAALRADQYDLKDEAFNSYYAPIRVDLVSANAEYIVDFESADDMKVENIRTISYTKSAE